MATFARYFKVCKEDDTVTADQLVSNSSTPAEGSSEGSELQEVANETEQLQESNEQAAEVVKEVEGDIAAQEEIVEKSPEAVTTQDAVTATESFKVKASKLGVDLDDLSMSINKESIEADPLGAMKDNIDNMKKFVIVAKESINTINRDIEANCEYMWDMVAMFNANKEYNTFDWPKAFLGSFITGLFRKLVNRNAAIKINNPGILVDIFLGKWTTFGDIISGISGIVGPFKTLNVFRALRYPSSLINAISSWFDINKSVFTGLKIANAFTSLISGTTSQTAASNPKVTNPLYTKKKSEVFDLSVKDAENAYYKLVTNLNTDIPIVYAKKLLIDFDTIVANLKKDVCKKCDPRSLTMAELNDLKLFKPDRIKPEIEAARGKMIKKDKEWDDIYNHLSKSAFGVVKYLTDNIVAYEYEKDEK